MSLLHDYVEFIRTLNDHRVRYLVIGGYAVQLAGERLGRVLHPRFTRALFGLDGLTADLPDDERLRAEVDPKPIRRAVAELVPKPAKP